MATPTVTQIRHHLVEDNGWTAEEFQEFIDAHEHLIEGDGSTTASFDEWEHLAQSFPA